MASFVYVCPICKDPQSLPIQPSQAPWCEGPENTHSKEMKFDEEASTGIPRYITTKKEGKKK